MPAKTDGFVLSSAATMIFRRYGNEAPGHVGERIGSLARGGDMLGVLAWQLIANRIHRNHRPGAPR